MAETESPGANVTRSASIKRTTRSSATTSRTLAFRLDTSGKLHGIYVQAQDFLIEDNTVINATDGNGISVRSSGVVRNNTVNGTAKSGISYYADHMRGPSNQLLIEDNMISNVGQKSSRTGIDLLEIPNRRYAVRNYIIRDNSSVLA